MRFGIGTAQFGFNYGITNQAGKVNQKDAHRIISQGVEYGMLNFDTAPSYGNAEKILGSHPLLHSLKITTKTVSTEGNTHTKETVQKVIAGFKESLSRLRLTSVYGLLIHDNNDIKKTDFCRLSEALRDLKADGFVSKIGISAYTEEDVKIADEYLNLDIIQLPINVFNQDLSTSKYIRNLSKRGVEIHARSIFLQGLILEDQERFPNTCKELKRKLQKLKKISFINNLSVQDLAVGYVKQTKIVDVAITGLCSDFQLEQLNHSTTLHVPEIDWTKFRIKTPEIIQPSLWTQEFYKQLFKPDRC